MPDITKILQNLWLPPPSILFPNKNLFPCLNFWDEAWYVLCWFFKLLSSSLWYLVAQRFSRCILWSSSGVPCLPERCFNLGIHFLNKYFFHLINRQTFTKWIPRLKHLSDKQRTPEEGRRIQQSKRYATKYHKEKDNSLKNQNKKNLFA